MAQKKNALNQELMIFFRTKESQLSVVSLVNCRLVSNSEVQQVPLGNVFHISYDKVNESAQGVETPVCHGQGPPGSSGDCTAKFEVKEARTEKLPGAVDINTKNVLDKANTG